MNERDLILNAFYRHRYTIRGRRIDIYPVDDFGEDTRHFELVHDEHKGNGANYLNSITNRVCTIPDLIKLEKDGMVFNYRNPEDVMIIFDTVTDLLKLIHKEMQVRIFIPSGVLDADFVDDLEFYRKQLFHLAYDYLIGRDIKRATVKREKPRTLINLFADPTPRKIDVPEIDYEPIIENTDILRR